MRPRLTVPVRRGPATLPRPRRRRFGGWYELLGRRAAARAAAGQEPGRDPVGVGGRTAGVPVGHCRGGAHRGPLESRMTIERFVPQLVRSGAPLCTLCGGETMNG